MLDSSIGSSEFGGSFLSEPLGSTTTTSTHESPHFFQVVAHPPEKNQHVLTQTDVLTEPPTHIEVTLRAAVHGASQR